MVQKRCNYIVTGRVQGVGFRYYTEDVAAGLKLTGWVRNLPDGSVEAEAQGDERTLCEFERALREGPPLARVRAVEATAMVPVTGEDRFRITH